MVAPPGAAQRSSQQQQKPSRSTPKRAASHAAPNPTLCPKPQHLATTISAGFVRGAGHVHGGPGSFAVGPAWLSTECGRQSIIQEADGRSRPVDPHAKPPWCARSARRGQAHQGRQANRQLGLGLGLGLALIAWRS